MKLIIPSICFEFFVSVTGTLHAHFFLIFISVLFYIWYIYEFLSNIYRSHSSWSDRFCGTHRTPLQGKAFGYFLCSGFFLFLIFARIEKNCFICLSGPIYKQQLMANIYIYIYIDIFVTSDTVALLMNFPYSNPFAGCKARRIHVHWFKAGQNSGGMRCSNSRLYRTGAILMMTLLLFSDFSAVRLFARSATQRWSCAKTPRARLRWSTLCCWRILGRIR